MRITGEVLGNKMGIAIFLFAIAMFGLAIAGGVQGYSSIPFGDMWIGTIGFISRIDDGEYIAWWDQHNEHRVVLGRILFWLDYKIFSGPSGFLIIANYIMVGAAAYLYWFVIKDLAREKNVQSQGFFLWLFITAWLFVWTQEENLTWGFQSHFFLAQLLPLCALFWLAKSNKSFALVDFLIACVFGVLSAGTMANGILALPLMFVCALIMRQDVTKSLWLLTLAVLVVSSYFHDYHAPVGHGHLSDALVENPLGLLHYTMLYLGSPFYYLFGQGSLGKAAAVLSGVFLTACSILIAFRQIAQNKRSALVLALVFFILYIGGTAFVTGCGRLILGLDQALSLRYTTSAIMAWAALIAALWGSFSFNTITAARIIRLAGILIGIAMLNYQIKALKPMDDVYSVREVAALALTLGIKDFEYIRSISPNDPDQALKISKIAIDRNYSIFGKYPYSNLRQDFGTRYDSGSHETCLGSLDKIEPIEGVPDYVRVHGWLFSAKSKSSPKLIRFINQAESIVGFGLTGTPRWDVAKAMDSSAGRSGFRGYLQITSTGSPIAAIGDTSHCRLDFLRLTGDDAAKLLPTIPFGGVISKVLERGSVNPSPLGDG